MVPRRYVYFIFLSADTLFHSTDVPSFDQSWIIRPLGYSSFSLLEGSEKL